MKAVLGLAILCCFVIGSLGVGCPAKNCKNMLDCACKNQEGTKLRLFDSACNLFIFIYFKNCQIY